MEEKNLFIVSMISKDSHLYELIKSIFYQLIKFSFILFNICYYLYYLSLERCMKGMTICCKNNKWIQLKLIEAICSAFILSFLIELMIFGKISKLHLIHVIFMFLIFYIYSHGMEFYDHGLFNILGYFSIVFFIILFLIPFNILIYLKKSNNKYLSVYIILLIIGSFSFFNISLLKCHNWSKGLNNSFIENNNNKYSCNIKFPKYCPFQIGKYFLDITKLTNFQCGLKDTKKNIIKFSKNNKINKDTKFIGFPITNKNPICFDNPLNSNPLKKFVRRNLININNQELSSILNNYNLPEIILDFSKNKFGEMIINLNYNKSLSEERKKMEKNSNPYSNNILILYIDSVSRNTALRQLKKTTSFFYSFFSNTI